MMRIKLSLLQKIITEALENAYDVLGVQPGASRKEILAAWRRLVHDARATRGGGRGGQEGALINYYNKAVKAALASITDPSVDPTFEPRAPRMPRDIASPEGWNEETAAADLGMSVGGSRRAPADDASFDVAGSGMARVGRKPKESYKVYGTKDGRSVIRVKGQLYSTGPGGSIGNGQMTRFTKNSRANVALNPDDDGRSASLSIPGEDYSQTWNAVDEIRRVVDELIIESLYRETLGSVQKKHGSEKASPVHGTGDRAHR